MALTTERIRELWENYSPTKGIESFARSVEAEVRKDDDALIQLLLDALEDASDWLPYGAGLRPEGKWIFDSIESARARLEKAP